MDSKRVLRILILCELALVATGITAEMFAGRFLPQPLRQWLADEYERDPTAWEIVIFALALPWLVIAVLSWVGLWRLWRRARPLYLLTVAAGIVLESAAGPSVHTGPTAAIWTAQSVMGGVILGFIYTSPIRVAFERPSAAPPGGFEVTIADALK